MLALPHHDRGVDRPTHSTPSHVFSFFFVSITRYSFSSNQFHTGALTLCHTLKKKCGAARRATKLEAMLNCTKNVCNYAVSNNEMYSAICLFVLQFKTENCTTDIDIFLFRFSFSRFCDTLCVNSEPLAGSSVDFIEM